MRILAELLGFALLLTEGVPCPMPPFTTVKTDPVDVEAARQALIECVRANANAFASPGRAETVDQLKAAAISREPDGTLYLGRFGVDPIGKIYWVTHSYGNPEKGFHEIWHWSGAFERDAAGRWAATKPYFQKSWSR